MIHTSLFYGGSEMRDNNNVRVMGLEAAPPGMARVWAEAPTPSYIVDEARLTHNLSVLAQVKRETGCRILLAQKAFSMFRFYPLIRVYLDGSTASGLFEARLGKEEMGGETHVFSPAYREDEFDELLFGNGVFRPAFEVGGTFDLNRGNFVAGGGVGNAERAERD